MQVKRQRRNAQGWASVLARFAASGLSAAAFCRREGISAASFYQWRTRLEPRDGAESAPAKSAAGFIRLGTLQAAEPLPAPFELRLDLGGGLTLQLRRG